MAKTIPTQIRLDAETKLLSTALFKQLGLDMSSAVNMFLKQCVLKNGIPFEVNIPSYNQTTLAAMEEARQISRDPSARSYSNTRELMAALDEE